MLRRAYLLASFALAASASLATGCLDEPAVYDVEVQWATENPPPGIGTARVTASGETVEIHGYTGTARVAGESQLPEIEICVELGTYEVVEDESTYCELFADCAPSPTFVAMTDRQCVIVPVEQPTVNFSF